MTTPALLLILITMALVQLHKQLELADKIKYNLALGLSVIFDLFVLQCGLQRRKNV